MGWFNHQPVLMGRLVFHPPPPKTKTKDQGAQERPIFTAEKVIQVQILSMKIIRRFFSQNYIRNISNN